MNELIKTSNDKNGDIIISGRELHEFLGVKTRYNDWFERMLAFGFAENVDYITLTQKRVTAQGNSVEQYEHHLKLDMAKEISMIQRTEKGKQARQYFLQLEKMWNSPEMVMKRALEYADKKVLELSTKIEEDKPKVFFAEAISVSKTCILVKDLAILLAQKGIEIGQQRLFKWLRENEYLCKSKPFWNKPTQRSMELSLFEVSTHIHTGSDGVPNTKYTPKVTGKGQIYFINKFLEKKNA
ncbi:MULTISPECIES: phage antirepressor KilAC domain-containing protein [Bacillus]|uniref:phage antirepressor KilAC domain-containing protein n=1 Tax=Bacillus TaxID=1386 RepID=UPI00030D3BF7|nr:MULTISPECIES: phage antirepressor KilAC domain-containing protein [Bacillus]